MDLKDINTKDLESWFTPRTRFKKEKFKKLLCKVLKELKLYSKLKYIGVHGPDRDRAELWRKPKKPWPSPKVELDIYIDRYLDERLLMHEFAHEADRWDPDFNYKDQIDKKFAPLKTNQKDEKYKEYNAYNLAWNISIDSRYSPKCLSKKYRFEDYLKHKVGDKNWLEELWAKPPKTHSEIVDLANKFIEIINEKGIDTQ